ncbi:hypothetical protein AB833_09630 [Chromatiales bacterium (ex Bugula neritina AB1)]|nr:hypothetical protein AB833_09630 [Chromatiales bacterium (ex Bugula neritina AB1)]
MPSLTFSLDISPEEYQRYYRGTGKAVLTVTDDGQTLEFPASRLTQFVSHSGVQGRFEILFDNNNKFVRIRRLR